MRRYADDIFDTILHLKHVIDIENFDVYMQSQKFRIFFFPTHDEKNVPVGTFVEFRIKRIRCNIHCLVNYFNFLEEVCGSNSLLNARRYIDFHV